MFLTGRGQQLTATPKQREHAPLAPNCTEMSPEPFRKRRSQPVPPPQPNTCTKAPSLQRDGDTDCDVWLSPAGPGLEGSEPSLPASVRRIRSRWWGLGNNHSSNTGRAHCHACPSHKPQCLGVATNKSNLLQGLEENLAGVGKLHSSSALRLLVGPRSCRSPASPDPVISRQAEIYFAAGVLQER